MRPAFTLMHGDTMDSCAAVIFMFLHDTPLAAVYNLGYIYSARIINEMVGDTRIYNRYHVQDFILHSELSWRQRPISLRAFSDFNKVSVRITSKIS